MLWDWTTGLTAAIFTVCYQTDVSNYTSDIYLLRGTHSRLEKSFLSLSPSNRFQVAWRMNGSHWLHSCTAAWETFSQLFCQMAVPRHTLGTLVTFTVTHLPFETRGLLLYVAFAKFVSGLYHFHMLKINNTCISILKTLLLASLLMLTSSQTLSSI